MWSLECKFGAPFTPELRGAWTALYAMVQANMLCVAERPRLSCGRFLEGRELGRSWSKRYCEYPLLALLRIPAWLSNRRLNRADRKQLDDNPNSAFNPNGGLLSSRNLVTGR